MTNPTSGHTPALPANTHDLATFNGRVAACCEWFDLEPPVLTYDPDEPADLLATPEFLDWMISSCVSLDWLVSGDVKGLVFGFRKDEQQRRAFLDAMRNFDEVELAMLVKAIKSHQVEHVPFEEALAEVGRSRLFGPSSLLVDGKGCAAPSLCFCYPGGYPGTPK